MTVAIFGSCVTRDLFEDPLLRRNLGHYTARSSVISVVAPPIDIDESRVVLSSAWQRNCVIADFRKTFFATLVESDAQWLVVDLIDERFDLLRGAGSFVTRSSAFRAAGLDDDRPFEGEPASRVSLNGRRLFEEAAARFAERVTRTVPAERVVLHRALWCTHYRSDGEIRPFPPAQLAKCELQNEMLNHGYDTLAAAFEGSAAEVAVDPSVHVADADHHWQLEPYHYEPSYVQYATERLHQLLGLRTELESVAASPAADHAA
jgi:hypothetical protein